MSDARDARRYRWLRDLSVPPHNFYLAVPVEFKDESYAPQQVDAAIDAAMGASGSVCTSFFPDEITDRCIRCGFGQTEHSRGKPPPPMTLPLNRDPAHAIEQAIAVLNNIVAKHPEVRRDFDCEAFIHHELAPALDALKAVRPEVEPTMWFSTAERVPGYDDDGEVLVVHVDSRRVGVRTARFLTAIVNEAIQNNEECAYTHWAPMPKAPSSPQKAPPTGDAPPSVEWPFRREPMPGG